MSTFHRENISSIYLFKTRGLLELRLVIYVFTVLMKILAKAAAIFVPIAVPCVWRWCFP